MADNGLTDAELARLEDQVRSAIGVELCEPYLSLDVYAFTRLMRELKALRAAKASGEPHATASSKRD
jgi:hypothetical protein